MPLATSGRTTRLPSLLTRTPLRFYSPSSGGWGHCWHWHRPGVLSQEQASPATFMRARGIAVRSDPEPKCMPKSFPYTVHPIEGVCVADRTL